MTMTYDTTADETPSALLRWSAVFGGLILGLAMLLLLSALCLALAYGSHMTSIRDNLSWYVAGSAVLSLFVGAILTGYLSGVRGVGTGMLHGFALWGLLMIVTITVGIPSVLNVFGLSQIADQAASGRLIATGDAGALWATFWTILGGFIAAGLGGMIGGAVTRTGRSVVATNTVIREVPGSTRRVVVPNSGAVVERETTSS